MVSYFPFLSMSSTQKISDVLFVFIGRPREFEQPRGKKPRKSCNDCRPQLSRFSFWKTIRLKEHPRILKIKSVTLLLQIYNYKTHITLLPLLIKYCSNLVQKFPITFSVISSRIADIPLSIICLTAAISWDKTAAEHGPGTPQNICRDEEV